MSIEVWSRDVNRVRRGVLPMISISVVLRESDIHTWSVTLDGNDPDAVLAKRGTGVIIMDDDRVLLSGPILRIETESSGGVKTTTISGESDMRVLNGRIVYPDYTRGFDQQTTKTHHAAKGFAETLIVDLVNQQAGASNPFAVRQTVGLPLQASQGRGSSTSIHARWSTTVLDEIKEIARVGGLVVDLVQQYESTNLGLVFRVPVDRRNMVRFEEDFGLGDYRTEMAADTATTVIIGGQGTGTTRTIYGRSRSSAEWWQGRIEVWKERSDTTDVDEFYKTAIQTLTETAPTGAVYFTVAETADLVLGTHYNLGDTVTVALGDGVEIIDRVRAAEVEWDEHGRTVKLTVGNFSTEAEVDQDMTTVRRVQDDLRRLEAR